MCPHCGFNYRIEVTPVRSDRSVGRMNVAGLYLLSAAVPVAGFVAGAVLERERGPESRKVAGGCVALAALNMAIAPFIILRFLGLA